MSLKKTTAYWFMQGIGWSCWFLNEILGYWLSHNTFSVSWLLSMLFNISFAIFMTHSFRIVIKRYNWLYLPLPSALLRLGFGIVAMALLMTLVNIYWIKDFRGTNYWVLFYQLKYVFYWIKPFSIWIIFYYTAYYVEKNATIELEKMRLQASAQETEVKLLRTQINPHFIFNALNSIRALVIEEPAKAQTSISQLANILRASLVASRQTTISLSEEVKILTDYLNLEKVRYEERLSIQMNIAPLTLSLPIPPMLLQTLAENAIKHGIAKQKEGGFIAIVSQIEEDILHITLTNSGVLEKTESQGFGLENARNRLKLLFGENAYLSIQQKAENIVSVELFIKINS